MTTGANVAARFDELDKEALVELANRFQRSQSDILRVLVREAVAVLKEEEAQYEAQRDNPRRAKARRKRSKLNHV